MTISQLSIFAENKPGTIYEITRTIADAGVDIRALSVADTQDFGILRLIVSDIEKARQALNEDNCVVSVTQVIGVAVPDKPGGLADVLKILKDADINVEYVYAFITISGKNACVVLRVGDNEKAVKILKEAGVELLTEDFIKQL
jgi:hypothetical protein